MRPDEPVSRIMTEAVVAIDVSRPVSEALDCFFQYPIHHLPVMKDGKLAGMLSAENTPIAASTDARAASRGVTLRAGARNVTPGVPGRRYPCSRGRP